MPDIITTGKLYCTKNVYTVSSRKNTNNAGVSIAVGKHTDSYQAFGFFAFEDGGIPANAKIVSAELHGTVLSRERAGQYALTVHPCAGGWAEETLTYNTMPVGSGAAATVTMGEANTAFSADITAVAQAWFGGGFAYENGLYITSSETGSYKRVYPRTDAAGRGAYIDITYYIPASTPTFDISSADIAVGTAATIYTNRLSGGYTHTLSWRLTKANGVTQTGTIASGIGNSTTWVLSSADVSTMLNFLRDTQSATLSIVCTTYDETGALLGTEVSSGKTMYVPSSVVPAISNVTVTNNNALSSFLLQGISSINVSIEAAGVNGSTIKKYETIIDDVSYIGSRVTSPVLTFSGTKIMTIKVTDTRDRTAMMARTLTVHAYDVPKIANVSVSRCNSTGTTSSMDDEYLKFTLSATASRIDSDTLNTLTVRAYTKPRTSTTWTLTNTYAAGTYNVNYNDYVLSGTYSNLNSYDIRFEITDTIGSTTVWQGQVGTQNVLLNFDPENMRIKAGTVAEADDPAKAFIFALDAYFRKKLYLSDGVEISEALAGIADEIVAAETKITAAAKGQSTRTDELNTVHRQTIGGFSAPFALYRDTDPLEIMRIGKTVQMTGALTTTTDVAVTDSSEQIMFTVPEGYRPDRVIRQLCQGSQRSIWMLTINPDGTAMFSRYRSGDAYATAAAGTWLPFHLTWIAAALSTFAVRWHGAYCTVSIDSHRVTEGEQMTAQVVPTPGYAMKSIKVTMGDADISAACVEDFNIYIPMVFGDVYIEAIAVIVPEWMVDVIGTGGALEVIELVSGAVSKRYDGAGTLTISKFGGATVTEENGNVKLS